MLLFVLGLLVGSLVALRLVARRRASQRGQERQAVARAEARLRALESAALSELADVGQLVPRQPLAAGTMVSPRLSVHTSRAGVLTSAGARCECRARPAAVCSPSRSPHGESRRTRKRLRVGRRERARQGVHPDHCRVRSRGGRAACASAVPSGAAMGGGNHGSRRRGPCGLGSHQLLVGRRRCSFYR